MKKGSLTAVMITLNEEYHLYECIKNISQVADHIFIVDSLSSDKTIDIALENGATVVQRPFTNFGNQWNFALKHNPFKTEWIMKIDPDERLTDKLIKQIKNVKNSDSPESGYDCRQRLWFLGKPVNVFLKNTRIWKNGSCIFTEVAVNEHAIIDGKIGYLSGFMEHLDSRDLHHWLEKQNFYTSLEANRKFNNEKLAVEPNIFGNRLQRRMFFKTIFF